MTERARRRKNFDLLFSHVSTISKRDRQRMKWTNGQLSTAQAQLYECGGYTVSGKGQHEHLLAGGREQ